MIHQGKLIAIKHRIFTNYSILPKYVADKITSISITVDDIWDKII